MLVNCYMPQGRIRELFESEVEDLGRSGSLGSFTAEVMTDLRSEGVAGNI